MHWGATGIAPGEIRSPLPGESVATAVEYGLGAGSAAESIAVQLDVVPPPRPHRDVTPGHVRVVLGAGYVLPTELSAPAAAPSGGESLGMDVSSSDVPAPDEGVPLTGSSVPCVN